MFRTRVSSFIDGVVRGGVIEGFCKWFVLYRYTCDFIVMSVLVRYVLTL